MPAPKIRLHLLLKRKHQVERLLVNQFNLVGEQLSGSVLVDICTGFIRMLRYPEDFRIWSPGDPDAEDEDHEEHDALRALRKEAVLSVLAPYLGKEIDLSAISDISVKMAGWFEHLKHGIQFQPWDGKDPVWACLHLEDLHRVPKRGRKYEVTLMSYVGPTSGIRLTTLQTGGCLQNWIREAGCKKYDIYVDEAARGLWFTAVLSARDRRTFIEHLSVSHSQQKRNKDLQLLRQKICRVELSPRLNSPCGVCPISVHDCLASFFGMPYNKWRRCASVIQGRRHQGYFRNDTDEYCLDCMTRGRYRPKDKP